MQEFTFPAWASFGKGDGGETSVEVELTDGEAKRLVFYGTQADIFYEGFSKCTELEDLYARIYSIAIEQMTDEMREFGDSDDEEINDPNWKVNNTYACGVEFPYEFEEIIEAQS